MKPIHKPTILLVCLLWTSFLTAQVQLLNDEFDNAATLSANWLNITDTEGWNAEHLETFDINTSSPGHLYMMPYTSSWYQNWRGTLIHKRIDQNFVFTTEVTATNRDGTDMPGSNYSLAGVMIRTPRNYPNGALVDWTPGGENYIFLATGFAATNHPSCQGCPGPHFEVKSTTNSNSQLMVSSLPTASNVRIRMARIDDAIIVLYQLPGESWQVRQRYRRTDFPAEMEIGLVTYTDWNKVYTYVNNIFFHNSNVLNDDLDLDASNNEFIPFNPTLVGQFDFARFDDVAVPPELAGVDLVNAATDEALLSFLGYDTQAFCPENLHVDREIAAGQIASLSVGNYLTADNLINTGSDVYFSAGNSVELGAGFEVRAGAELTVEIGGCN